MSGRLKKSDWEPLRHHEKEELWLRRYGRREDDLFPTPITTAMDAKRVFAQYLNCKPMPRRAMVRRGWLAAEFGGRCRMDLMAYERPELGLVPCGNVVADYRFLRLWEFNHITGRADQPGQFVISGSDCARRSWDVVKDHCMNHTVLLCRECHHYITELEKEIAIETNRILLAHGRTRVQRNAPQGDA